MEFLTYIFSNTGLLNQFLGGYYYVIPFFLFIILLLYLHVNRVSSDNIMIFFLIGLLLVTIDNLFNLPVEWIIGIIILSSMVIGTYLYTIINR